MSSGGAEHTQGGTWAQGPARAFHMPDRNLATAGRKSLANRYGTLPRLAHALVGTGPAQTASRQRNRAREEDMRHATRTLFPPIQDGQHRHLLPKRPFGASRIRGLDTPNSQKRRLTAGIIASSVDARG